MFDQFSETQALCRPLTGAWIETSSRPKHLAAAIVAPSRGRGLKHLGDRIERDDLGRPLTGAWIETTKDRFWCPRMGSPPHGGVD